MILRSLIFCLSLLFALPATAEIEVQTVTSAGGIEAWLVEDHSIPFVALEVGFRGGTSLDAPGKRGATNLMVSLLEEGAGDMDSQAFSRALEEQAAAFSYKADDDEVTITARILTENRDASAELLRASITAPRFEAAALERVRAQVLSIIRSNLTDPQTLASEGLSHLVYGDHPYGSSGNGSAESVTALTREDIIGAHQAALTRDRLVVSAVGDITPDQLTALLDRVFGDLPQSGGPKVADAALNLPGGITVQSFDTPQSVAVWAQEGVEREDPDFFAAYVLNQILGAGGFESRLMDEVREKRGLTYGVQTYLINHTHADIWAGSMSSANDRVKEAVDVVRAEWDRAHDNGVTQEELDDAKTYLTGAFPLRFDGNARIAGILTGMQLSGLQPEYLNTRNDKINAVTLDDVNRVARERMSPENLTFYVVGQPVGM